MTGPAPVLDLSLHTDLGLPAQTPDFGKLNAVEDFYAKLTKRQLKCGVFHSLVSFQAAIKYFAAETNDNPVPFR